ncbi:MAG: TetR/AcrR family transcriptional regulator [Acidobacteria bacterium]|nr:TetR/AcrR family transcriptional regulator [Acidobacteriota bacterium]
MLKSIAGGESLKTLSLHRERWIKKKPTTDLGQRIISSATNEFATKGVLGARVAEITRLAGTTDPAFYRYFAGIKQAALFIMSEYYWAPLNLRLNHYQQISNNPLQLFEAVIEALIHSTEDDHSRPWLAESNVFRIVVAQMRNPVLLPESLLDLEYLTFIEKLESIIYLGQQQNIFANNLRPSLIAQILVTSLHSLLLQSNLALPHLRVEEGEIKQVAYRLVGLLK